jgi:hypothetical protein
MYEWQWHMTEESFARQPHENRTVFANRPEHAQVLELAISFTENVHALGFEFVQMIHT